MSSYYQLAVNIQTGNNYAFIGADPCHLELQAIKHEKFGFLRCNCRSRTKLVNPHLIGSHLESVAHVLPMEQYDEYFSVPAPVPQSQSVPVPQTQLEKLHGVSYSARIPIGAKVSDDLRTDLLDSVRFAGGCDKGRIPSSTKMLSSLLLRVPIEKQKVIKTKIDADVVHLQLEDGDVYHFLESEQTNKLGTEQTISEKIVTIKMLEAAIANTGQTNLKAIQCLCLELEDFTTNTLTTEEESKASKADEESKLSNFSKTTTGTSLFCIAEVMANGITETGNYGVMRIADWPYLSNSAALWIKSNFPSLKVILVNQMSVEREISGGGMGNHRILFGLDQELITKDNLKSFNLYERMKMEKGNYDTLDYDTLIGEGYSFHLVPKDVSNLKIFFEAVNPGYIDVVDDSRDVLGVYSCVAQSL